MAIYSGDGNFAPSQSEVGSVTDSGSIDVGINGYSPDQITPGVPVTVSASVYDPCNSGSLTYEWYASGGKDSFISTSSTSSTSSTFSFTPNYGANYLVGVEVTDGGGYTADPWVFIPGSGLVNTTTTLTVPTTPVQYGQAVTLTASVAPQAGNGTPTGNVEFYANGTDLGGATLDVNSGIASLTVSNLPAGANSIVATYDGDDNFATSNSSPASVTVVGPLTATITGYSPAYISAGTPETVNASVTDPGNTDPLTYTWTATDGTDYSSSSVSSTGLSPTYTFTPADLAASRSR